MYVFLLWFKSGHALINRISPSVCQGFSLGIPGWRLLLFWPYPTTLNTFLLVTHQPHDAALPYPPFTPPKVDINNFNHKYISQTGRKQPSLSKRGSLTMPKESIFLGFSFNSFHLLIFPVSLSFPDINMACVRSLRGFLKKQHGLKGLAEDLLLEPCTTHLVCS